MEIPTPDVVGQFSDSEDPIGQEIVPNLVDDLPEEEFTEFWLGDLTEISGGQSSAAILD